MKILITSATSADAHKLKNKLAGHQVILGDDADLPAFMRTNIIKLPAYTADTYAHEMLTLSLDNDVEAIYLLKPEELAVLLKSEILFKEYNINIFNGQDHL